MSSNCCYFVRYVCLKTKRKERRRNAVNFWICWAAKNPTGGSFTMVDSSTGFEGPMNWDSFWCPTVTQLVYKYTLQWMQPLNWDTAHVNTNLLLSIQIKVIPMLSPACLSCLPQKYIIKQKWDTQKMHSHVDFITHTWLSQITPLFYCY